MEKVADSCKYCDRHVSNLRLCSRCKQVYYCTKVCQTLDWSKHRAACVSFDGNEKQRTKPKRITNVKRKEKRKKGHFSKSDAVGINRKLTVVEDLCSENPRFSSFDTAMLTEVLDSEIAEENSLEQSSDSKDGNENGRQGYKTTNKYFHRSLRTKNIQSDEKDKRGVTKTNYSCFDDDLDTRFNNSGVDEKMSDDKNKTAEKGYRNVLERNNCEFCASPGCLQKCARCKEAFYCSSNCQRQDWIRHKDNCRKKLTEEDERILKDWQRKQDHVAACKILEGHPLFSVFNTDYRNRFFQTLTKEQALQRASRPKGSLSNAVQMAKEHFPLFDILTDFQDIPSEQVCMVPLRGRYVLVAFMYRFHEHVMRHGVYLEDARDVEIKVEFYLDHIGDNPSPFFTYSQIKPGGYICLQDPVLHQFKDGTVGFRINNPEHVRVLDIKEIT